MRKLVLLAAGALLLTGAGCSSGPEVYGSGPEAVGSGPSAPSRSQWSKYLNVMSDKERVEFQEIDDEFDRNQWIRRNGIDVRADLTSRLARGISVEAARRRIQEVPDETVRDGSTTMLFYSRYNTQSHTNFWLKFENDQLLSWNAYTDEMQRREREVLNFEADLMRNFDIVLERGMGMQQIRIQARNAQDDLNDVELAHRERIYSDQYKGTGKVSYSDYILAEQLLLARTRNEMFKWFQGRTPDKVTIHRPYETHHYYVLHTDQSGNETVVTVEFVFLNGLLEAWHVFHDR